jgi:hypothetical protein
LRKAPSLRNKNGAVQLRARIDGKDQFVNRLGRWNDPVAVAKAQALSAQIWSDYQSGAFDATLRIYQPLVNGNDEALLERLRVNAETEVGAFYWTVLAPDIVNSGREEQASVSV